MGGKRGDDIFLACAMDANADFIVSGDSHLLNLHAYKNIPILAAKQFAEKLDVLPWRGAKASGDGLAMTTLQG